MHGDDAFNLHGLTSAGRHVTARSAFDLQFVHAGLDWHQFHFHTIELPRRQLDQLPGDKTGFGVVFAMIVRRQELEAVGDESRQLHGFRRRRARIFQDDGVGRRAFQITMIRSTHIQNQGRSDDLHSARLFHANFTVAANDQPVESGARLDGLQRETQIPRLARLERTQIVF